MIKVEAYFYDGRSSEQQPVEVIFYASGEVLIQGVDWARQTTLEQISIKARLGNTQRSLFLADGGKLETADNDAIDRVCQTFFRRRWPALLYQLETHWMSIVPAIAISVLFVWIGIRSAVPVVASWVAKGIPTHVERQMGEQGLESLDSWLFTDTLIPADRQAALRQRFRDMTAQLSRGYPYRLLFRNSHKMGANALALPGGIIIITDGLIHLAENDIQILAVLAHEMGHVENQHGLRLILQNSLAALLMAGLLGDIASVTSLSVTLPTVLVESHYSRKFEMEADRYSVKFLQSQHLSVTPYMRMLTRLGQAHPNHSEFDYLSSHPALQKRLAAIEKLDQSRP